MKRTRWLLLLIATGTFAAIWTGWVQLGAMTGFGWIHPLPGIIPGLRMNAVITLPVSVEAYGAYALGVWLAAGGVPDRARSFARWSAIGALALGWMGQAASHVLTAAHVTVAPWPVTVLVSSVPVAAFGLAVALTHLLRSDEAEAEPQVMAVTPVADALEVPEPVTAAPSRPEPKRQPAAKSRNAAAERQRRYRERTSKHAAGDHSLCDAGKKCDAVTRDTPAEGTMETFILEPAVNGNGKAHA